MTEPDLFDRLEAFWRELVRRRVVHVAGVYAIVSWIAVYMVGTTYEIVQLPPLVLRFLLALTFLGFPVVLVLSWYFRLGRGGVRLRRAGVGPGGGRGGSVGAGHAAGTGLLLFGLVLAGGSYVAVSERLIPPDEEAVGPLEVEDRSVAVLPFQDLSEEGENRYFSDGMTDEVIARLVRVPDLKVISRTSAMRYRDTDKSPGEIGRELGVAALVEGSVQRLEERVRIAAHLVDTRTGGTLWADSYDRGLEDVFALQTELAERIAASLGRTLGAADPVAEVAESPPTADLDAYDLYLRGRFFWNQRTPEGLDRAIALLEEAVERDPGFSLAHAALADVYVVLPYHTGVPTAEVYDRVRAAANRALELNPRLGEAHAALGFAHTTAWEWSAAEEAFRRALDLSPGYATGHQWHALYLGAVGRVDEALETARRAQVLDPLSVIINEVLGLALYLAGDPEAAVTQFDRTLELDPALVLAHFHRSWVLEDLGRIDEMVDALEDWSRLFSVPAFPSGSLRNAYTEGGRVGALSFLTSLPDHPGISPVDRARWWTGLGRPDEAFRELDRALAARDPWLSYIQVLPFTRRLDDDPRLHDLLRRMGLSEGE